MSDKYYKKINDQYIEMTESEVDQITMEKQRQILNNLSSDTVTSMDLINMILGQYTIQTPDGKIQPATQITGQTIDLPIKLGQKWELVLDEKAKAFAYQLVDDPDAVGTADNPIIYYLGCPLINNAFYKKDGVIQVYMDGQWGVM